VRALDQAFNRYSRPVTQPPADEPIAE